MEIHRLNALDAENAVAGSILILSLCQIITNLMVCVVAPMRIFGNCKSRGFLVQSRK